LISKSFDDTSASPDFVTSLAGAAVVASSFAGVETAVASSFGAAAAVAVSGAFGSPASAYVLDDSESDSFLVITLDLSFNEFSYLTILPNDVSPESSISSI